MMNFTDGLRDRPISPLREVGAYEALWDKSDASFKRIAEMFRSKPGSVPSDFMSEETADDYAQRVVDRLSGAGVSNWGVRVHGAGEYPVRLRDAAYPVELLYYQGWWDLASVPRSIAVVGTRNPSDEGARRCRKLVRLLVKDRFLVVSGLAKGVDSIAHTTAIEEGGLTAAVIGTPLSESYPSENRELQAHIASKYLLISQVPVIRHMRQSIRGNRLFFPERNVTMSAMTSATVIVEAGETSGTLIQARAALAQGRKLFILDSCFKNPAITWPERFLKQGAIRVSDYEDIRRHLGLEADED